MLATLLSLINPALGVLAAFKGSAQTAKVTGYIQDAAGVVNAVVPLINQFASGKEVTPDDVRSALAGMDAKIAEFDALIAAQG